MITLGCIGTFIDDRDVKNALLGDLVPEYDPQLGKLIWSHRSNGVWHGPGRPVNTRVTAVITIRRLSARGLAYAEPTLWTNPWADRPPAIDLPFRRHELASDGRMTTHEATLPIADILGLDR